MLSQDTVSEESHENDEVELQLTTWSEIAANNIPVLEGVIQEIVQNELPHQLFEAANTISAVSTGINSLKNSNFEHFERLVREASCFIVVLWQIYNKSNPKYHPIWPPPDLRKVVNDLVDTVYSIHKLMNRKCEKNPVKRALVGYFGIRNLGKFKKYQRRLDAVAAGLETQPNDIMVVLLEVINSRAQPQDENSDQVAPIGKKSKKRQDIIEESMGEGSLPRRAEKSTSAKPANRTVLEEDDQRESKSLGKQKAKDDSEGDEYLAEDMPTGQKSASRRPREKVVTPQRKGTKRTKAKRTNFDEQSLESDDKRKRTRHTEPDEEDSEEGSSRQAPQRNNTGARSKAGQKLNQAYDDEETSDVPTGPARRPPKKKPVSTQKPKVRSQTTPAPPQSMISGLSFENWGTGDMTNTNVGNIYNSSISGVGNNYSKNYYGPRRRPTHA